MVEIKKNCNAYDLTQKLWSGGLDTLMEIIENDKADELMQLLEDIFYEATDITTINDFLRFDSDYVYEQLGMQEGDTEGE